MITKSKKAAPKKAAPKKTVKKAALKKAAPVKKAANKAAPKKATPGKKAAKKVKNKLKKAVKLQKKIITTTTVTTTTTKTNPKETHYLLILDESGSMESVRQQTLDGLNEQIQSINKLEKQYPGHKYFINILKFDNDFIDLVVNTKISDVRKFTLADYKPNASTALRDAIGLGVTKLNERIESKITSGEARALVVILTDGEENASNKYSPADIKSLIEKLDATQSWTFTFIGANQDAVTTAKGYGIHASNVANYSASSKGTRTAFAAVSGGMSNMASGYMAFCGGTSNRAFMSSVLQDSVNIGEDETLLNVPGTVTGTGTKKGTVTAGTVPTTTGTVLTTTTGDDKNLKA